MFEKLNLGDCDAAYLIDAHHRDTPNSFFCLRFVYVKWVFIDAYKFFLCLKSLNSVAL